MRKHPQLTKKNKIIKKIKMQKLSVDFDVDVILTLPYGLEISFYICETGTSDSCKNF